MATITGSISPSSKESANHNGSLIVTFTGVSQDDETNQSVISYKVKGTGSYWLYGYGWYWSYDNSTWTQITQWRSTSSYVTSSNYTKDTWKTGSFAVPHDDNGQRTFYFKLKHLFRWGANDSRWNNENGKDYNATVTSFACTLSEIPLQTVRINVNGTWKRGFPYVNVNGTWKKGKAFINVNGTWKKGK